MDKFSSDSAIEENENIVELSYPSLMTILLEFDLILLFILRIELEAALYALIFIDDLALRNEFEELYYSTFTSKFNSLGS